MRVGKRQEAELKVNKSIIFSNKKAPLGCLQGGEDMQKNVKKLPDKCSPAFHIFTFCRKNNFRTKKESETQYSHFTQGLSNLPIFASQVCSDYHQSSVAVWYILYNLLTMFLLFFRYKKTNPIKIMKFSKDIKKCQ